MLYLVNVFGGQYIKFFKRHYKQYQLVPIKKAQLEDAELDYLITHRKLVKVNYKQRLLQEQQSRQARTLQKSGIWNYEQRDKYAKDYLKE